ncbi:MAG TPA: HepT-like ribonuclease domain-containing protein [Solirubrobacteraceae bacterium]
MSRAEHERLRDIRDAITAIRAHLERAQQEPALADDPLLHDALLYEFVVIGEAVKHLSAQTRARAPEVPWQDVAGLRDLIAHEYFHIEIQRVLEIVDRDLPALEQAIARLQAQDQPNGD